MNLPVIINIQGYAIYTFYVFLFLGILNWLFVIWYEARKDGFDVDKMFDMFFVSAILAGLTFLWVTRTYNWFLIYQPFSPVLQLDRWLLALTIMLVSSLVPLLIFCNIWHWSKYRILDIYSLALTQLGFFLALGSYLTRGVIVVVPFILLLPLLYLLIKRLRSVKLQSGFVFSFFVLFNLVYIAVFYRKGGYLLFCFVLLTISFVNLIFRWRKSYETKTLVRGICSEIKSLAFGKGKKPNSRKRTVA
ncbi:hypothetical protein A3K42_00080 [candidate division WWE3 bacterium RBG_13_37_7]|uniref:Uncharacterized protein n=1 Tax=candidate division WWE3 bacterium RBG_13_37_7 TaxID=1802609 RepID=A0A1F4U156_UNCKA|nr:MAG: hypothetical protein A3K42_00080 [candidate division WWE3 bacterium RBG_13_37_7]